MKQNHFYTSFYHRFRFILTRFSSMTSSSVSLSSALSMPSCSERPLSATPPSAGRPDAGTVDCFNTIRSRSPRCTHRLRCKNKTLTQCLGKYILLTVNLSLSPARATSSRVTEVIDGRWRHVERHRDRISCSAGGNSCQNDLCWRQKVSSCSAIVQQCNKFRFCVKWRIVSMYVVCRLTQRLLPLLHKHRASIYKALR